MSLAGVIFTPRSQKVLDFAKEKARSETPIQASPSDIVFGLLDLGAGVAFKILKNHKIDAEILAQTLTSNPDSESYKVLIPPASDEARRLSHTYIGTEYLLLALLKHPTNALTHTLRSRVADPNSLRREILQELDPNFDART